MVFNKNKNLLLSVFSVFIFNSCQPQQNKVFDASKIDTTAVPGGTFIEASIGDATFLNPLLSSDSASNDINNQVFNGLIKYDKNIKIVGDLAESFEIKNGGKEILFHLRKNVKWHDGVPFTAEDVLFTYQKLIDPKTRTPFSSDYLMVKKAEILDPYTFRVSYDKPFSPALESWGMGMIPKHIFETGDINTHPANKKPIGTGPFKFESWATDEKIVLRANLDYFEGRPLLDRYVYRIIPDLSVQFLELRQGSLSTMTPSPDQYNGYEEFFTSYNKFKYPAFRYDYIAFNLKNDLFKDKRVRQALALALNKNEIIEGVYQGLAVPATGPFPPQSWAYNPNVVDFPYDIARAKALLAEAGWKDSDGDGVLDKDGKKFEFTLITNQGNKVRESIAQIAQNAFQKVGVKMEIRIIEWSVFIQKYVDTKNFDAVLLAWSLSRDPDPYPMWHSSQTENSQYNFISYKNPEVDQLLIEGRETFDPVVREKIYRKIHALIADDVPYLFLVNPMSLPVIHKKILGVEQAPAGLGWNFNHWYIPKAWQDHPTMAAQ